jgi:Tol biopolymer transport system component
MRHGIFRNLNSLRLAMVVTAILAGTAFTCTAEWMVSNSTATTTTGSKPSKSILASTNGAKIVFGSSRLSGNHDIYVMDVDGNNQTRLTTNAAYDDQPKWSPDGTRILFMSDRDGNFEIYLMNANGSSQTRLTNNPAADGFPAWSPDGTKIAFVNGDLRNPSTFEIYVMNADGSNRTRLTNDSLIDGVPAWSPDGTKIVFMSGATSVFNPNTFEIFVMNADGNSRTQLTNNGVVDGQPSYSPDGTKILFASGDAMSPNGIEIFVMNANGSNRVQITTNAVTEGFPAWAPDGTKIIFASGSVSSETSVELFVMNADGSNRTQLTTNSTLDWFADWQPVPVVTTSVQFSSATYSAGEGDASVVITVNRTLDTTGTSTVDFASSNGSASQAKDYQVASGTLTFTPGITSRTFRVLLVDDAFVEGNETLNLTLSNATGAIAGSPNAAVLTIVDNDTAGSTSPVAKQFVADLTGAHEVPPTNSLAKGGGVVQLSASETTAKVSLVFSQLTNGELIARIHGPSGPETNAPPIFILPQGSPVVDFIINPTPQNVADLKAALHYINVHGTGGFANGEIRGQLLWNPVEEADFFVRQAYFDFLSRVPDTDGLAFWIDQITQCQSDVECLRRKRVDVSNAFFYEQEFQQTAAYVLRLYRGAYGNNQPFPNPNPNAGFPNEEKKLPSYAVFVADRARVIGGANLAQKQLDLANLFVARPEFVAKYPASLATADQFVDAVLLTLQNDLGVNLSGQRTNLINLYNTQGGRAAVMYRLADDNATNPIANQSFIDAEYNRSFVLGQYFGYLRRDPDIPGFMFWLGQVNGAPVRDVPKQHAMVCSFVTSGEFQFRFGPVATRNNNECPQ